MCPRPMPVLPDLEGPELASSFPALSLLEEITTFGVYPGEGLGVGISGQGLPG